jgi:hypothetical protein
MDNTNNMVDKYFRDIAVGQRFTYAGIEYLRTEVNRISCCKATNAQAVGNPSQQNYFSDDTRVQFNG